MIHLIARHHLALLFEHMWVLFGGLKVWVDGIQPYYFQFGEGQFVGNASRCNPMRHNEGFFLSAFSAGGDAFR